MAVKRAPEVPITEPKPVHQRIAWWIENAFVRMSKRVFNGLKDAAQDMLVFAVEQMLDAFEGELIDDLAPLMDQIEQIDDLPQFVKTVVSNARSGKHQAEVLILVPFIMALINIISTGMTQAISPAVSHTLNRVLRLQFVDPHIGIELYRRGIISNDDLLQLTHTGGWPDWQTEYMKKVSEVLYSEGDLLNAKWRGLIPDTTVDSQLKQRGYSPEYINLWHQLSEGIPSPGDLISIAVREGFDDAVASKFGYDEAFPGEAAAAAEKGGMPTEWFRRLWRAHWRLPSITQGFDMFHRGIMSKGELELLMRAADIPSFWRSKLIQLSYNVVTRVDIRRMYQLGVVSVTELYERYLAGGYNEADATKLTEWTIAEYAETERELTKTDILSMYRENILNDAEATAYLSALGYEAPTIGLLLVREQLRRDADYEKEIVKNVKAAYMAGIYDENNVRAELGKLDPPAGYVDDQISIYRLEKTRRVVRPTSTQLRDMWQAEVISERQLDEEMAARGYSEQHIEWYKALWSGE